MSFTKSVHEGRQGRHRFFTTSMRWGELDQLKVLPEELEELDEDREMQRGFSRARIEPLKNYLVEADDHFFSALTLIILPRDLQRPAREGTEGDDEADFLFVRGEQEGIGRQTRGTLHLSGEVRLFAADGQHRLRAGIEAVRQRPDLAKEEVPVVLVPYQDEDQVRQLFADLNLNAKPVSKTIGYSFDTRDPLVQIAKAIGRVTPLFRDRVNQRSNSLPETSAHVITMNQLVEGSRNLLLGLAETHAESSTHRREPGRDIAVKRYLENEGAQGALQDAWDVVIEAFQENWAAVLDGAPGAAGKLRKEYVFPHGLGWGALTDAAGHLIKNRGTAWKDAFLSAVRELDWKRGPHWEGIAMSREQIENTAARVKATAGKILGQLGDVPPGYGADQRLLFEKDLEPKTTITRHRRKRAYS